VVLLIVVWSHIYCLFRLSAEDKRQAMLGIFRETKEVFNLKELEKLGTKEGVVTQTIKDVVQGLRDDSLIDSDKIGRSVARLLAALRLVR
jgi:hypothetical protein